MRPYTITFVQKKQFLFGNPTVKVLVDNKMLCELKITSGDCARVQIPYGKHLLTLIGGNHKVQNEIFVNENGKIQLRWNRLWARPEVSDIGNFGFAKGTTAPMDTNSPAVIDESASQTTTSQSENLSSGIASGTTKTVRTDTHTPSVAEYTNERPVSNASPIRMVSYTDNPPPLERLLKKATPSNGGLYPHEILMLHYAHTYKIGNNRFEDFWLNSYSVKDPQKLLNSLFERGFIGHGDLRSTIEKLKVTELKEELRLLNEKVSGKKAELIDRLLSAADHEILSAKYPDRFFKLTPKGEQELKENEYVPYLCKKGYMSVWEMNHRLAQTDGSYSYRDILWRYFNEQSGLHFRNGDFGLYRNTRLEMYLFLMEENKLKTAFHMLCEILSFDLSGLGNDESFFAEWERNDPEHALTIYKDKITYFFPYEESILTTAPAISAWFANMQERLNLNDTDYRKAIIERLNRVHPPRRVFTDEECADIILADIHEDIGTLKAIYKKAERREKAKLKEMKERLSRS